MMPTPQNFYHKAKPHAQKILICIGFFWLLLLGLLYQLPVDKSSTAFFPDSSKPLQSMVRAMNMTSLSQFIYIDFSAQNLNLEDLAIHVQNVKNQLDPMLIKPAQVETLPQPENILALLPSLFTAQMEQELTKRISANHINQALQNAQGLLLGLPAAGVIPWLRHDPLNMKDLILHQLPQKQGPPSIDPQYGFAKSADDKHLLLVLSPTQSIHDTDYALKITQNIESALTKLPQNIEATVIGGVRHTAANTKAIDKDILWISVISILGIAAIYLIFIRSLGGVWLLLTPCLAVTLAFGMVHIFFGFVSGLALGFGMSILGIAEDYAVHMHFALRSNKDENIIFKALTTPLFQGFLLNISGFALLLFSAIPAVRQLSAFAIVALFVGLVLALYILPLCAGFNRPFNVQGTNSTNFCRFPRLMPTLGLSLALIATCTFLFSSLPVDISPRSMGANVEEIQNDSKEFFKTWQMTSPNILLVEADNGELALKKTRILQESLQYDLPQAKFTSLASILPSNAEISENIQRWNSFISNNKSHILQDFSKAHLQINVDEVFFPFFAFLNAKPTPISLQALQAGPWAEFINAFLQNYPQDNISQSRIFIDNNTDVNDLNISHDVTLFTPQALEENLRTIFFKEARYLPVMFILCLVLLFLCFKNIAQTCLAALPALGAIFCIFFTMFLWQIPLTLAGLAAMPLVLGLSIDHGIMSTHHLAKGIPLQMNRAILVSSLTACVSMGMLAFASHPTLKAMGHVIFIGLLVEMPVAIWLLPRLCKRA